ncbi:hypothetical protein SAMN05444001_11421 [Parabacteroides chinchillae]|uniref:Uncharacterized protein n=1 Tax=Parabacteroides chinchillae TaxID=871327 RepID=A0A8G2BXP8_9BACT|nr:hypothetical protein SAMN05444001_11421 [Parabacteroides chinchillae]
MINKILRCKGNDNILNRKHFDNYIFQAQNDPLIHTRRKQLLKENDLLLQPTFISHFCFS